MAQVKEMVFKEVVKGTGKQSGKPFVMVVLHDPDSLENVQLFLPDGSPVQPDGFKFKEKVKATIGTTVRFGKFENVLTNLTLQDGSMPKF